MTTLSQGHSVAEDGPVRFAMVGGGWRAGFFLRVAEQLPARFQVTGLLVRDAERRERLQQRWGVRAVGTVDELLTGTDPDFAVVSVTRASAPTVIAEVTSYGLPVLTETPPGADVDALVALHALERAGARIQVAEQYHLQPLLSAQLQLARSGALGRVSFAHASVAHDYHGISLLRRALGIGFEDAVIRGREFRSALVAGPDRNGDPVAERSVEAVQTIAEIDFGDRLGVYDFSTEQYFSWIRTRELLIRGDRGEVRGPDVRYLQDVQTPVQTEITRMSAGVDGNHEGMFLRGLLLGERWLYRNPYLPARLNDDELAVAACLSGMHSYARGGPGFYSLAEASQDHYLQLMVRRAVSSGETITTSPQPWARR